MDHLLVDSLEEHVVSVANIECVLTCNSCQQQDNNKPQQ